MPVRAQGAGSLVPFATAVLAVFGATLALGTCLGGSGSLSDKSAAPQALSALAPDDVQLDALVVDFKDGTTKAQYDEAEKAWGVDVEFNSVEGERSGITQGRVDPAQLEALLARVRQDPRVESAEPLLRYRASFVPNDPQFKAQWNLELIGMREAWDMSRGGGVTVAVIDTGIAYEDHGEFKVVPDLKGAKFAKGYDFVNDDEHANDDHGHGTHVAGTVAQVTNNAEGVAGIAFEATLMPVKVLDANGTGSSADIADAIRWAADHGARVLNLSLGGGGRSAVMADAVSYARKKGAVVVCAAGNGGRGVVEYPAAYPGALAVSAIGPKGELAFYSSWGKELDLAAPGGDKRSSERDGVLQNTIARGNPGASEYAWYQGTSMATPHVAGVAALLFAAGAGSPDEVERALFSGADHSRSGEWNEKFGHGVLSAKGALAALGCAAGAPWWKRGLTLVLAFILFLLTRLTMSGAARKAFKPGLGFALALLIAGAGLFFLPWMGLGRVTGFSVIAQPVVDWGNAIFGGGRLNPFFYSAAVPLLLSIVGFRNPRLAGVLAGVGLAFAAAMFAKAFSFSADVAWIPWRVLSALWLVVNGMFAWLLARAAMQSAGAGR